MTQPAAAPAPTPTPGNLYVTYPITALTFDQPPPTQFLTYGNVFDTTYTWVNGTGTHVGLATFSGPLASLNGAIVGDYIDLNEFGDGQGTSGYSVNSAFFQQPFGGAMSFEMWVQWDAFNSWGHLVDIGGPWGDYDNNIVISHTGTSNQLVFQCYNASQFANNNQVSLSTSVYSSQGLSIGTWYHVVGTIAAINGTDTTSTNSALYSLYLNGVNVGTQRGILPPYTARPNAYIGKSNWGSDSRFQGEVDGFWFYNYSLTADQVAAHSAVPRPPVFDVNFASDPRVIANNSATATYSWLNYDPTDLAVNNTLHQGILLVSGVSGSYANLANATGPQSVGTTLPTIGGAGSGVAFGQEGWSIELAFKVGSQESWGKIFDWGQGPGINSIVFGLPGSDNAMRFQVFNAAGASGSANCIGDGSQFSGNAAIVYNVWYHVVLVMAPSNYSTGLGAMSCYVNGQWAITTQGYYPQAVVRSNGYIGKSEWFSDQYFNGSMDYLRVYDYALTEDQANALYVVTTNPTQTYPANLYTTGPINAYTFDSAPFAGENIGSYGWQQSNGSHLGVATFAGPSNPQYVNLLTTMDSNGNTFPNTFGGATTFEAWVMWTAYGGWARVFDIGNGQAASNIILAAPAGITVTNNTFQLAFQIYNGGAELVQAYLSWTWVMNTWQHVVVTTGPTGWNRAVVTNIYMNGRLAQPSPLTPTEYGNNITSPLPILTTRVNAYLGKSDWNDAAFTGMMDSFYYYNYALDSEAVAAHYVLPRAPVFELTFGQDPRPALGLNSSQTTTYGWISTDTADSPSVAQYHSGILTLQAPNFVNLSTPVGINSVGTTLPAIGGVGGGNAGNQLGRGWTFEIVMKPTQLTSQTWAKIFDLADAAAANNIIFTYNGDPSSTHQMGFQVFNNRALNSPATYFSNFTIGAWHHFVFTVAMVDVNQGIGLLNVWLNGQPVAVNAPSAYPLYETRRSAYLGLSNWGDAQFDAKIDRFAIYDYIMPTTVIQQMTALYGLSNAAVGSVSSSSSAAPAPSPSSLPSAASSSAVPASVSSSAAPASLSSSVPVNVPLSSSVAVSSSRSSSLAVSSVAVSSAPVAVSSPAPVGTSSQRFISSSTSAVTTSYASSTSALVSAAASSSAAASWSLGCSAAVPTADGSITASILLAPLIPQLFQAGNFAANFAAAMAAALNIPASAIVCLGAEDSAGNLANADAAGTGTTVNFGLDNSGGLVSTNTLSSFNADTFNSALSASTGISTIGASQPTCASNCGGGGGGNSLSGGAIAGIVIGGVVGVCCLILIAFLLCFRSRENKTVQRRETTIEQNTDTNTHHPHQDEIELPETAHTDQELEETTM